MVCNINVVREEFMQWVDEQCMGEDGWTNLYNGAEWVSFFKRSYKTDESLRNILAIRDKDGLDSLRVQLENKMGHKGVGRVVDEIVGKLQQVFEKGPRCYCSFKGQRVNPPQIQFMQCIILPWIQARLP